MLRNFGVNPGKGLLKHKVFWALILVPVSLGLVLMVVSAACAGLLFQLDLTPQGFNFFYSEFKFHLALMALAIPLGATFSRAHSSEQTASLITQAIVKDNKEKELSRRQGFLDCIGIYDEKLISNESRINF